MSQLHAQTVDFAEYKTKLTASSTRATSLESIAKEIQELPYTDINVYMSVVRKRLHTVNRWKLNAAQREEILQPFNQAFEKCVSYYRNCHKNSLFSSQPPAQDLAELSLFSEEMASGHKQVFLEYLHSSEDDDAIAQALYYSLYFAGQCMLQCYERNLWQSPHLWQQVHCLYQLAEDRGYLLLDITTEQPEAAEQRPITIESLYTQILLTTLADPYQRESGQHWLIYEYAGHCCHLAHLHPVSAVRDMPDHGFMVRLDSDKPPLPIKGFEGLHNRSVRLLDTEKLNAMLDQQVQHLRDNMADESLGGVMFGGATFGDETFDRESFGGATLNRAELGGIETHLSSDNLLRFLSHLQAHWCDKPFRNSPRETKQETIFMIWGMHDIFSVHDPVTRRTASEQGKPIEVQDRTTARIEDENRLGYCVTFPTRHRFEVNAGQLVCIVRRIDGKSRLELGAVRWSNIIKPNLMRAGIQKIQATVRSVKVGFEVDSFCDFQGLLLSNQGQPNEQHSLILPRGYFESNACAYLQLAGQKKWYKAMLNAQTYQSDVFDWFDIELALNGPRG